MTNKTKGKENVESFEFEYTPFGFDVEKYVERYEKSIKPTDSKKTPKKEKQRKR